MDENNLLTVFDGDDVNDEGNRMYPQLPAGKIAVFFDKGISPQKLMHLFMSISGEFRGAGLFEAAARADQWAKRVSQ